MICQTRNKRQKCYTENEGISMWGCVPLSVERIHYLCKNLSRITEPTAFNIAFKYSRNDIGLSRW